MAQVAVKFGVLFIKTLTKPFAKTLASQAREHPRFKRICVRLGQVAHQWETSATLRIKGHHAKSIKPLPAEDAASRGATVLSEVIVFSTAGVLLVLETGRKARVDKVKAEKKKDEMNQFRRSVQDNIHALEMKVLKLERRLAALQPPGPPPVAAAGGAAALAAGLGARPRTGTGQS